MRFDAVFQVRFSALSWPWSVYNEVVQHVACFQRLRSHHFLLACLVLAGCPAATPVSTSSSPTGGDVLKGRKVAIVAPARLNLGEHWQSLLEEWSAQTGATTRVLGYDDAAPFVWSDFEQLSIGEERLWMVPQVTLAEVDDVRGLAVLPTSVLEWNDFPNGLRERVLTRGRRRIAVPIAAPTYVCAFRSDLLTAAGRRPPATWSEYRELMASISDWGSGLGAVEPLSPGIHGTHWQLARGLGYSKHPSNLSVWFDMRSGASTLPEEGFTTAQKEFCDLVGFLDSRLSLSATPQSALQLVMSGRAALAIGYFDGEPSSVSEQPAGDGSRASHVRIGFRRLPGAERVFDRSRKLWDERPSGGLNVVPAVSHGGLYLALETGTAEATGESAAGALMEVIAGPAFDSATTWTPRSICRVSQKDVATRWLPDGLTAEEAAEYVDVTLTALEDPQLETILPIGSGRQWLVELGNAPARRDSLTLATEQGEDSSATKSSSPTCLPVADHAAQIEAAAGESGRATVRDSYRKTLGLRQLAP